MAHQIERSEDMFSVREVPWHGLGKVLDSPPCSEVAIIEAGLDWKVRQEEAYRLRKSMLFFDDPMYLMEPDYFFNVREDTDDVLGVVGKRYKIVQNVDAFKFTDELIGTGEVRYETAGCLNGGKRIWVLAQLPDNRILGEQYKKYLCFTHGHDGFYAIRAFLTTIRVVCNNTLSFAIQGAQRSWSTKHVGDIQEKLSVAQMTLGLADTYMEKLNDQAELLVGQKVSVGNVLYFNEKLFPVPDGATDRAEKNILSRREDLLYRFNHAPDLDNFRYTKWGYLSAVSDYVTHGEPQRMTANFKENRFSKIIYGNTLIDKAYQLLVA